MIDSSYVRKRNKSLLASLMLDGKGHTKQELSEITGLSIATCNTLLNELEAGGVIVGEKHRLKDAGRNTAVYSVNEAENRILCLWFELKNNKKFLCTKLLSSAGRIIESATNIYSYITEKEILSELEVFLERCGGISQIIIGTPSIVSDGVITHCDFVELENIPLESLIQEKLKTPVHIENDMHLKTYGYYKKQCNNDDTLVLMNFQAGALPSSACVHKGAVITGTNQFAGNIGFIPYDIPLDRLSRAMNAKNAVSIAYKAAAALICTLNPSRIVFTGELMNKGLLKPIYNACLETIPRSFMPEFIYAEEVSSYYLAGMYQRAVEIILSALSD